MFYQYAKQVNMVVKDYARPVNGHAKGVVLMSIALHAHNFLFIINS